MASKELHQYYTYLNDQGSPHGFTSGALNFFLAATDTHTPQTMERAAHWNSLAQQSTSAPVYGPSNPPRLQQFVDLARNVSSMTPIFFLNSDIAVGERGSGHESQGKKQGEAELAKKVVDMGEVFDTPRQRKERLPMALITPTSSTMGMTVSPATRCHDLHQITPAETVVCGASVTSTTSTANTANTTHVNMRVRPQVGRIRSTAAAVVQANSLANELESAFQEHRISQRTRGMSDCVTGVEGNDEEEEEEEEVEEAEINNKSSNMEEEGAEITDMALTNAAGKTSDAFATSPIFAHSEENMVGAKRRTTLTRREERTTQRRNKDQRHGKSKNSGNQNSQRHNNQLNKNSSSGVDNTGYSLLSSPTNCDNAQSMGNGTKYMLSLLCHGGRKVTVASTLELHAGDHVLFEGDRGVDLGEVIGSEEAVSISPRGNKGNERDVPQIVRHATEEEVEEWKGSLVKKEEEALTECRAASQELGLPIHLAGAAFQFDRQKLIFSYESDERVDFRALLQVMFSKYRCRIWMERTIAPS